MTLHTPKLISSTQGLGLDTGKSIRYISDDSAITTEIWGKLDEPWSESGTIIAQEGYKWVTKWKTGRSYIITKIYNDLDNLIGIYCDISSPVKRVNEGFEFYDMYLDVWQMPRSLPIILDEDELADALKANCITKTEADAATKTAKEVVNFKFKTRGIEVLTTAYLTEHQLGAASTKIICHIYLIYYNHAKGSLAYVCLFITCFWYYRNFNGFDIF